MDRTMVKRGIGAAVLAIAAGLLLAYLLKGKSHERQEVVDMSLPGAQEVKKSLNIPALKGSSSSSSSSSHVTQKSHTSANESVVATAEAAKDIKLKEVAVNTFKNKGKDVDFTIRPPKGEKREFVDNIGKAPERHRVPKASISHSDGSVVASESGTGSSNSRNRSSGSITRSSHGTVVASAAGAEHKRKTYRPRLEGERRRNANYGLTTESSVKKERLRKEREKRRAERRAEKRARAKAKAKAAKEKESAKTDTKATSSEKGHYTIQLLATSSASRATNLKKVMRNEGYHSFISKAAKNGKSLFRVNVGNYNSQKAAKSAQKVMKRRYRKNQQVKDSIIVSR